MHIRPRERRTRNRLERHSRSKEHRSFHSVLRLQELRKNRQRAPRSRIQVRRQRIRQELRWGRHMKRLRGRHRKRRLELRRKILQEHRMRSRQVHRSSSQQVQRSRILRVHRRLEQQERRGELVPEHHSCQRRQHL